MRLVEQSGHEADSGRLHEMFLYPWDRYAPEAGQPVYLHACLAVPMCRCHLSCPTPVLPSALGRSLCPHRPSTMIMHVHIMLTAVRIWRHNSWAMRLQQGDWGR